jgi:hypothetical protein
MVDIGVLVEVIGFLMLCWVYRTSFDKNSSRYRSTSAISLELI